MALQQLVHKSKILIDRKCWRDYSCDNPAHRQIVEKSSFELDQFIVGGFPHFALLHWRSSLIDDIIARWDANQQQNLTIRCSRNASSRLPSKSVRTPTTNRWSGRSRR